MNNQDELTAEEKLRYLVYEIEKVLRQIPPYYAYGDNEAGVYMSNMLYDIGDLIQKYGGE
jgi:hypothetical protein